ncbi:Protein kinase-like domain superfamily protein [Pleurotus pulmonarius]
MHVPDITSSIEIDPASMNVRWTDEAMIMDATYVQNKEDKTKNTAVCIKTYPISATQTQEQVAATLSRVQREAEIWMDANHPNIIPCFGMSQVTDETVDPQPALVFLRCSNGSLEQYLTSHGDADVHTLVIGLARGLHYLHEKGVVHGNLRPHNIMVLDNGEAALSDFCRSKFGGHRGQTTRSPADARFSAPESQQSGSAKPTKETDVYSFGLIALFIYVRKLPLSDHAEALAGSELRLEDFPTIPKGRWDIISPCWQYSPDARPAMAEVLARLLE